MVLIFVSLKSNENYLFLVSVGNSYGNNFVCFRRNYVNSQMLLQQKHAAEYALAREITVHILRSIFAKYYEILHILHHSALWKTVE